MNIETLHATKFSAEEQSQLISDLLALKKTQIRDFLGQSGLARSGSKEEIRNRVEDALARGTLLISQLVLFLNEVIPCRKQHVFVDKGPNGSTVNWKNRNRFSADSASVLVSRMPDETLSQFKAAAGGQNGQRHETFGRLHTDDPLSDRAQLALVAMLELRAIDSDARRCTEEIAVKALGGQTDGNSLKNVISELHTRRLIETKAGRGGGCWLTAKGRARAEKLCN